MQHAAQSGSLLLYQQYFTLISFNLPNPAQLAFFLPSINPLHLLSTTSDQPSTTTNKMFTRTPLLLTFLILLTTALSLPTLRNRASTCSANTDKLVSGINKNIDLQKQEQSQLKVVKKMVDAGNVDQSDFDAAKSKFVDIVNAGITQRKANQELADGNKAADGLATVSFSSFLFFSVCDLV